MRGKRKQVECDQKSENENCSYPNLVVDKIEVVKVTRVFAM